MDLGIVQTPRWLSWHERDQAELLGLKDQYLGLLSEAIGARFANLIRQNSSDAALIERWEQLPDEAMDNIITAPQSCFEGFYSIEGTTDFSSFMRRSIIAEMFRSVGKSSQTPIDIWSAQGDILFAGSEESRWLEKMAADVSRAPMIGQRLFVDFRSPYALGIALDDDHYQLNLEVVAERLRRREVAFYDPREEYELAARLERVLDGIYRVDGHIGWFVEEFTLSLIIRRDESNVGRFTSGSSNQFVGRTCLINPTAPGVDDAVLADALVHEAIHSVLYMQERKQPWVKSADVYFGVGYSATSPWTGSVLTPRQFMQACFVWFGLYHFWCSPGVDDVFGSLPAARQRAISREGFYKVELRDLVSWSDATDGDLLSTLRNLQKEVVKTDYPEFSESLS